MFTKDEAAAIEESRSAAWFAVEVTLGGLALHFVFGTLPAILFIGGWLWGEIRRQPSGDEEEIG